MEKIMLYPFSDEEDYYLKYYKLLNEYTISSLVCLKGSGYKGKAYLINDKEIVVTENFEGELGKCSAILPLFSDKEDLRREEKDFVFFNKNKNEIVLENLKNAIVHGKKIFIFDENLKEINELKKCIPQNLKMHIRGRTLNKKEVSLKQFHYIKTPTIYITSVFEGLNKMDILLAIYYELQLRGYKVLAFGTRQGCELFGICSYPKFMYDEKMSDNQKILFLNSFIKMMETEVAPDLILVGVPGGTAPFSVKAPLDFGTTLYKMIRAMPPDYFILSLPYSNYSDIEYQYWEIYFKTNFGIRVDSFNISPKAVLQQMIERNSIAQYLTVDKEEIKTESENNIFCFLDNESVRKEVDRLIQQLEKYGEMETV